MKIIQKVTTKPPQGKGLILSWGLHPFIEGQEILVVLSEEGLYWLGFGDHLKRLQKQWPEAVWQHTPEKTQRVAHEFKKLWPLDLDSFSTPLILTGTAFQNKVWQELLHIAPGATSTYGEIARRIGHPQAVRAVGTAVGRNPISVIVPCHRVVHTHGGQMKYAWGPALKESLLRTEAAACVKRG